MAYSSIWRELSWRQFCAIRAQAAVPAEAVQITARRMLSIEMLIPLNISILAERVVRLAIEAQQLSEPH